MMVSTIKSLPLNVTTVRGESATSLASRIARKNGTANLQAFCVDMGIAYGALRAGDPEEIERLATLARCDPAALCNSTPRALSTTKYRLGAETLKFTAFRRTTVRGCPRCVAEAKAQQGHYGPFSWGFGSSPPFGYAQNTGACWSRFRLRSITSTVLILPGWWTT